MQVFVFFSPGVKLSSGSRLLMSALTLVKASCRVSPSTTFCSPSRTHKNSYEAGRKSNEWGSCGQRNKKRPPAWRNTSLGVNKCLTRTSNLAPSSGRSWKTNDPGNGSLGSPRPWARQDSQTALSERETSSGGLKQRLLQSKTTI